MLNHGNQTATDLEYIMYVINLPGKLEEMPYKVVFLSVQTLLKKKISNIFKSSKAQNSFTAGMSSLIR